MSSPRIVQGLTSKGKGKEPKEVPVIDLASFGDDEAAAAEAIRSASEHVGFFYISGHGVSPKLLSDAFEQSKLFFELPLEEKMEMVASEANKNRGYTPWAEEWDPAVSPIGDQKEGLYFGREVPSYHIY